MSIDDKFYMDLIYYLQVQRPLVGAYLKERAVVYPSGQISVDVKCRAVSCKGRSQGHSGGTLATIRCFAVNS